ncbi:MAG: hypothetical protein HWN81_09960 [Candidatus Lokiarchaeota archaeon]|nr:hypothetical protein [Candidatus Lokiarchaeota archaeon]
MYKLTVKKDDRKKNINVMLVSGTHFSIELINSEDDKEWKIPVVVGKEVRVDVVYGKYDKESYVDTAKECSDVVFSGKYFDLEGMFDVEPESVVEPVVEPEPEPVDEDSDVRISWDDD